MNSIKKILLLLCVLMANVCFVNAKTFTLFSGKKVAQIYLADNEPMPLKIAAGYLRDDISLR